MSAEDLLAGAAALNLSRSPALPVVSNPAFPVFDEEPVSLTRFIQDQRYLGNPPLSAVQYEAVQYAERVYYQVTCDWLAANAADPDTRAYWAEPVRMVNFLTYQWGKGCPVKGSVIYDARTGQWVAVEDWAGSLVASSDEEGRIATFSSSASWSSGRGRSLAIRLSSGLTHRVYEGHRYLTPDGWRYARELQVGDKIGLATRLPEPQSTTELPSHEVELVGWWLGDGVMPADPRRGSVITLFAERETAALAAYVHAVGAAGAVAVPRKAKDKHCWYVGSRVLRREKPTTVAARQARVGLKRGRPRNPLNLLAEKYGLAGKTAHDKRVPAEFFSLPTHQVALFLSRLWGTDGWVHVREGVVPEVGYCTVSEGLAWDVQRLLLRIGCLAQVQRKRGSWTVRMRDRTNALRFCSVVRLLDKGAAQDTALRANCRCVRRGLGDVQWTWVREITDIGEQEYYDLEVPGPQNYVGDGGTINHNSGKDHCARIISLRVAYLLLCLRSPQAYFGMPEQDTIHLLNVAVSSGQANRAFFTPMRRAVGRPGCWFQDIAQVVEGAGPAQRRRDPAKPLMNLIRFDKNIEAISGHSDADSQEGLNLVVGIADEIDGFRSRRELEKMQGARLRESSTSAEAILEMLRTSGATRFPHTFKNVRISYPRYLGSTIQKLTAEARADNHAYGEGSRHFVSGPLATWDVNPRVSQEDFSDDYRSDAALARAKYECRPSRAVNPYFANFEAIQQSCYDGESQPLDVADYAYRGHSWEPVYHWGALRPVRGARYAIHADLAVNGDRAGIAMAHVRRHEEVQMVGTGSKGEDVFLREVKPRVRVDFAFCYQADAGRTPPMDIQIRWFRMLVMELRRRGFPVVRATADRFQSVDTLQILEAHGVETDRVSTDRNEEHWQALRDMAYEGRLEIPRSALLLEELEGLSRMPSGKIDHLGESSKDIADAVACALTGALEAGGQEDPGEQVAYPSGLFQQWSGNSLDDWVPIGFGSLQPLGAGEYLSPAAPLSEQASVILDGRGFAEIAIPGGLAAIDEREPVQHDGGAIQRRSCF